MKASQNFGFLLIGSLLLSVPVSPYLYSAESSKTDSASSSSPSSQNQDAADTGPHAEAHSAGENRISMDFKDALLPEVLSVLSPLAKVSFVTAEDASTKKINLFLENVVFEDALKAIVQGNGLIAQRVADSNIYMIRVGTGEDALIPLETRVFKLKYLRATKVKELTISESSSTSSSGSSSSSSSTTGSSSGSSSPSSSSVGGSTSSTGGEPAEIKNTIEDLLSPRGKVTVNDRNNSLVVTDTPDRLEQVTKVLQILDHPLDQVLIEAIILERAVDFNKFIGSEWGTGSEGTLGTVSGVRGKFSIPFINQAADLIDRGSLFDENAGLSFGQFDFSQMQATLKALQTDSRSKVLAKPKILVLDNEPAFIKITVNAVIGTNQEVTAGGGTGTNLTATSAERSELGVTLKVTPLINDERTMTILLEPRYATADTSSFNSQFRDPRVRASRTTLSVESGKIITISGLLQREETKAKRKLPILGDIPLFGIFFTKWTTQKSDRELIIFLRPFIVHSGDLSIVRTKSIPDEMTSPDEESAEFWKYWEKPWYKKIKGQKNPDVVSENEDFSIYFHERDKAMDQTLSFYGREMKEKSKAPVKNLKDAAVSTDKTKNSAPAQSKSGSPAAITAGQNTERDIAVTPIPVKPA